MKTPKPKKPIAATLTALMLTGAISIAQPIVLNFDDIPTPGQFSVAPMPAGYGGLNWDSNFGVWGLSQPPYTPHSPPNRVVLNPNGGDIDYDIHESHTTFIGAPRIFDGAYFSGDPQVFLGDGFYRIRSTTNIVHC